MRGAASGPDNFCLLLVEVASINEGQHHRTACSFMDSHGVFRRMATSRKNEDSRLCDAAIATSARDVDLTCNALEDELENE